MANLTVTSAAAVKLDGDPSRKSLLLQNQGSVNLALGTAAGVTCQSNDETDGHVIQPGDFRLFTCDDARRSYWFRGASDTELNYVEGF